MFDTVVFVFHIVVCIDHDADYTFFAGIQPFKTAFFRI